MQATLIARDPTPDANGNPTTQDYTIDLVLPGRGKQPREAVKQVPASEWAQGTFDAGAQGEAAQAESESSIFYRPHSLPSLSPHGSGEPNEFATFVQGREVWLGNAELREKVEDDFRSAAERVDQTEGFLLTTPLTSGSSGLSPLVLELLRDEFAGGTGGKSTVWVTGLCEDAEGWARGDSERSASHRLLNTFLSLPTLEDLSSLLLPIQPCYAYSPTDPRESGWTRYFNPSLSSPERYAAMRTVREMALNGAGEELRVPGAMGEIVELLSWRGNKVASLSGVAPVETAEFFEGKGEEGVRRLRESWKDFSVLRPEALTAEGVKPRPRATPFAQYSILRGLTFEENQALGPLLEKSVEPLREPWSKWVTTEQPYPILPSTPPIFAGLLPTGRPLTLPIPTLTDPQTSGGLFGLPDPRFPPPSSYTVQPASIPILTTLSTRPDARYFFRSLLEGVRELRRTRAGVLREYEAGEFGVGVEGIEEARERLETLFDNYGGEEEGEEDKDEDENWDATEPKDEFDFDLEE
ncbi:hypothetical protein JCM10213_005835 [Rhodosporidiobolus nylandii]